MSIPCQSVLMRSCKQQPFGSPTVLAGRAPAEMLPQIYCLQKRKKKKTAAVLPSNGCHVTGLGWPVLSWCLTLVSGIMECEVWKSLNESPSIFSKESSSVSQH